MMGEMKDIRRTTEDVRAAQDICGQCGEVAITNDDILVRFCEDNESKHTYVFACPKCHAPISKPIERMNLDILVENGCPMERWTMPKEIFEQHIGEPLTLANALDFHFILEDEEAIAKFFEGEAV